MSTLVEIGVRELDHRSGDGIEVTLLWDPRTNRVFVAVDDGRHGGSFRIEVEAAAALDAFQHPYAYAGRSDEDDSAIAA